MKFTTEIYANAEEVLAKRRDNAETLALQRQKEFYAKFPEARLIEDEMKQCALEVIHSVGGGKKVDVQSLARKNLEAQRELSVLLSAAGLPADYLDPPYSCKLCKDTGSVGGKLCSCHLALLKQLSLEGSPCGSILYTSTFDTFDLDFYSARKDPALGFAPREYMRASFDSLREYAERFPNQHSSYLFSGPTGLGKTHLALAVMNRLTERGYSVYYASAGRLLKQLEKERFGRDNANTEEEIAANDLFILDDLGTEFRNAFSVSEVYELINSSLLAGRPMIICTNLTADGLLERYGEGTVSRMNSFEVLNFCGTDVRQIKK